MKFTSEKDAWLAIVLWVSIIVIMGFGISVFFYELHFLVKLILLILCVVFSIFFAWVWFSTYYVISEKELIIKNGPFKHAISLSSIKKVSKSSNPVAVRRCH